MNDDDVEKWWIEYFVSVSLNIFIILTIVLEATTVV